MESTEVPKLARLLFAEGNRHVTAEILQADAEFANINVSQATVYNTLHQFAEAGLLRELAIEGPKMWFDTNVSEHHHFIIEDESALVDIPGDGVLIGSISSVPEGMEIERVEVVVRADEARCLAEGTAKGECGER
ncbi:MAG TPA: transcriptional repressor, partial [Planctomycetes bacterium]|nr:transcriptional repressor [Planctomycetota bacterium]